MSKIELQYRDSDGYWIDLTPGWKSGDDPIGCVHGIHEDTKREALAKMKSVMKCDCDECEELIKNELRSSEISRRR